MALRVLVLVLMHPPGLWNLSPGVEVDVLNRQIPVRIEDLEAALLFLFVKLLVHGIRIELLDDRRAVEIVFGNGGVLVLEGDGTIPEVLF